MTRRSSRSSRLTTSPQGVPDPTMPADVETLQAQLRLSRKPCAYLHRALATALTQGPLAPSGLNSEVDALRAAHVDLHERLTLLTRHYEALQHRVTVLEPTSHRQQ